MIISYAMFLSYKVKIKVHSKEKLHAVRFVFIYFPYFQSFHGFLPSRKPGQMRKKTVSTLPGKNGSSQ